MTQTQDVVDISRDVVETGPLLADGAGVSILRALPPQSGQATELDPDAAKRAQKMKGQMGRQTAQRTALLGLLLARLEGVPFDGVAELLKVKEARLEKFMHGEENIPTTVESRWNDLYVILEDLQSVVRPEATWRWMNTSIPDLGDKTPLDSIRRNRLEQVLRLTKSYRDPSFH